MYNLFSVGTPIVFVRAGCLALTTYKIIILLLRNLIIGAGATIRTANELRIFSDSQNFNSQKNASKSEILFA